MITNRCHKDNKYRKLYIKFEKTKKTLRSIFQNKLINSKIRFNAFKQLITITPNSSISKLKRRCLITGRSRSIMRYFKVSRIKFRELASNSNIPGVTRSSW